ncbi:MAG: hypothetical protein ACE5FO_00275 [Parvularculaceae bacterium]
MSVHDDEPRRGEAIRAIALFLVILTIEVLRLAITGGGAALGERVINAAGALFFYAAAHAAALGWLASSSDMPRIRLAAYLAIGLYGVQVVLVYLETFFFQGSLNFTTADLTLPSLAGIATSIVSAGAAVLLFGGAEEIAPETEPKKGVWRWAIRLTVVAVIYPVIYVFAGMLFVWTHSEAREFYNDVDMAFGTLLAIQVFRGYLWAAFSLFLIAGQRGSGWRIGLRLGFALAVFVGALLFFPNEFMPPNIRLLHVMEIINSHLVFGILAGLILAPLATRR